MPKPSEALRLVHYGYLNNGVLKQPIIFTSNDGTKPFGKRIIWTSPEDSSHSFEKYAQIEGLPHIERPKWILELNPDANIAKVDSLADYIYYIRNYPIKAWHQPRPYKAMHYKIHWNQLSKDFDAFWLTQQGMETTNIRYMSPFHEWHCETVIIFNPKIVQTINQFKIQSDTPLAPADWLA